MKITNLSTIVGVLSLAIASCPNATEAALTFNATVGGHPHPRRPHAGNI